MWCGIKRDAGVPDVISLSHAPMNVHTSTVYIERCRLVCECPVGSLVVGEVCDQRDEAPSQPPHFELCLNHIKSGFVLNCVISAPWMLESASKFNMKSFCDWRVICWKQVIWCWRLLCCVPWWTTVSWISSFCVSGQFLELIVKKLALRDLIWICFY